MKAYTLLLLSPVILFACNKTAHQQAVQNTIFPNAVGDQWVYAYSPTGDPAADTGTVHVNVVGDIALPDGETAKIWVTKYSSDPGYADTTLVTTGDTAVTVYFNGICLNCIEKVVVRRKFELPLQIGNAEIVNSWDTTRVLAQETVQVPAGSFPNTFRLAETAGYAVNSFTRDTLFLTPGVGLTRFFQDEFSLGYYPGGGLWQLSSYKLN